MLYLVRKLDESIIIDDEIHIKVIELKRNSVKLGIKSSGDHSILRDEIHRAITNESTIKKDDVES
ncbi:CsrA family RNA-binding regulator [Candidatus Cyrtobacter comes]|uniref:CsrA family RNA-binding regulator n=1 Tax=Candidatus Cyrtobacter comes TaxID=675776 RepID=A0ABU5L8R1_9RICK|nr:carbon storage regulator [Candidatus Cyrtobacter comes]MDZ5762513.1 CsrA family RNA-binding regulator [Candidatus Cyrtobacter comes]